MQSCTLLVFPVPSHIPYSQAMLDGSTRYFSLVGWLVGGLAFLFFTAAHNWVPQELAIAVSMVGSLLLTGAFHEDGFADMCDGFGGGWTRDQTLAIMKDSRLGTYGAAGLGSVLLLKWLCLTRIPVDLMLATFIAGHAASRFSATLLIRFSNYARADVQRQSTRADAQGQSKPQAKHMGNGSLILSCLFWADPFRIFRRPPLLPGPDPCFPGNPWF